MEVRFATRKLQRRLNSTAEARRAYGDQMAKKIAMRLQQMSAARHLGDLRDLPGRWHELTGDLQGALACDLVQPYRLIFRPTEESSQRSSGGGLDWSAVDSVTVTHIDDYH